jgi:Fe-S-cluster containining protein
MKLDCGECHACCRIGCPLTPADDPDDYLTNAVTVDGKTHHSLQRKPNGDCIYLDQHGCAIHGRAPQACRDFDCRIFYTVDETQLFPGWMDIIRAGKQRAPQERP